MMEKNLAPIFKILSFLLDYPDEDYIKRIGEIEEIVADISSDEFKNRFQEFISYIKTRPLIHIREIYTAAFDMNPSTTLNLTYHIWGDNEKRAGMLTRLQQGYQDAGYERMTGELPDYLPLMLEFLAVCPEGNADVVIWECFRDFDKYMDRLEKVAPEYSALLQPLAGIAIERCAPEEMSCT